MSTTELTLRTIFVDHATGETGVSEDTIDRYAVNDTETRKHLAAKLASEALDNLNRD